LVSYAYDAMNRPINATWGNVPAQMNLTASSVSSSFGYDATNRLTSQTVTDDSWWNRPTAAAQTNYTPNNLNQYTAVGSAHPTYDGNGNLASDGHFTYCYDTESRLTSVLSAGTCAAPTTTVASYAYDAQGRRKSKTVGATTTVYVTNADNREVLEYSGTTGALQTWYAFGLGPDEVLNQISSTGTTRATLIPDVIGSIIGSLDAATGTLTKFGYQTFGENPSLTSGGYRYTARRLDPETVGSSTQASGLYYYRARTYSPTWGRFLQPDPIGYAGGANLYAYANNDPLNLTDPLGLDCVSAGGTTSCTTSAYSVSFPTPKGWQDFTSSSTNYHFYSTPANVGSTNPAAVQQWVANNPTPGYPSPAAPQGTLNDATPVLGGVSPINISPVLSYTTTNQANGRPVTLNVTLPGHPLFPGIVVRQVDQTSNGTVNQQLRRRHLCLAVAHHV
jgi:RHS repeat-associated protein